MPLLYYYLTQGIIKTGGHFCEIGKFDAHTNSKLGQYLLLNNVSFHTIDLRHPLTDPDNRERWCNYLEQGFERNEVVPLPFTSFDAGEISSAFRFMMQGKHVGKIVVSGFQDQRYKVEHLPYRFWKERHLITGGMGGLGFALAAKLAMEGSREIILVGRSGVASSSQQEYINKIEKIGCQILVIKASILDLSVDSCPPPDRIWHT